jgi:TolB protein
MRAKRSLLSLLILISIIVLGCGAEPTEEIVPPEPTPWANLVTQTPSPTASPTPTVRPEPTPTPSPRPVPTRTPPALGLNEGKIAFASDPDRKYKYEIYVIDSTGVTRLTFSNGEFSNSSPAWSPDGQSIAYVCNRRGAPNIYRMNADGKEKQQLTDIPGGADLPDWSPNGTRIVFGALTSADEGGVGLNILVIDADGSNLVHLTTTYANDWHPSWSPDGQKIVFDCSEGICTMSPDGIQREVIIPRSGWFYMQPVWSPDGRRIAMEVSSGHLRRIVLSDADGQNVTWLTDLGLQVLQDATWSPNGRRLAASDGEWIYIIDLESGTAHRLVQGIEPDWHE